MIHSLARNASLKILTHNAANVDVSCAGRVLWFGLFFLGCSKSNFYFSGRSRRWSNKLADCIEYDFKVVVILAFHVVDFAFEIDNRHSEPADLNESPHNLDVGIDSDITAKNTRQHGDALLRKNERKFSASAV